MIGHAHLFADKMQRCQDYVEALEEERRKILVFQRELPLCLELVTQAIEACKQQLSGTTTEYFHGQSECSGDTLSEGPVLEEFIPIKRSSSSDEDEHQSHKDSKANDKSSKKSDWLRSVQLWNQTPDLPTSTKEDSPTKVSVTTNSGGAFHPFKKEKRVGTTKTTAAAVLPPNSSTPAAAASSTVGATKKDEKDGQSQRKARRCWSPELHRRFLHALQQLGGSHVATPKQIRETMKVDGLSNDEVKSHLQKYRLHERRPTPSVHNNSNPQAPPQFVVVGGIWVPPPPAADYAAVATGEGSRPGGSNGIYAPIASSASVPPPQAVASQTKRRRPSHSDDAAPSSSPATSCSTRCNT